MALIERRPATIVFVATSAVLATLIEQALPGIFPDGVLTIEPHGIGGLMRSHRRHDTRRTWRGISDSSRSLGRGIDRSVSHAVSVQLHL
jgi:hypothetical protein